MLTSEVLSNDDELRGFDHKVVDRGKVGGDTGWWSPAAARQGCCCSDISMLHPGMIASERGILCLRTTNTFLLPELSWSSPEIVHFSSILNERIRQIFDLTNDFFMDWTMMNLETEVGFDVCCGSPRHFVATASLVTKTSIYPRLSPGVLYPRWFTDCT